MTEIIPSSQIPDKDVFIFDLDGTLAESKSPLTDEMAGIISELLSIKKVCVISGGNYHQFKIQVIDTIEKAIDTKIKSGLSLNKTSILSNLYIQPTSGARMYTLKDGLWDEVYASYLSADEKKKIHSALEQVISQNEVARPLKQYGDQVEDRGSQITFSSLGQRAPVEEKKSWDPDMSKKKFLVQELQKLLPEFEVHAGGLTSVDIVKKDLNKSYGIKQLSAHTNLSIDRMCFIGDAIYEGGNDYPAISAGVDYIKVANAEFTLNMLKGWLSNLNTK